MKKLLILLATLIGLTSCAFIMPSVPTTEPTSNPTTEPTTVPSVSNPTTNSTTSVDNSTVPTTSVDEPTTIPTTSVDEPTTIPTTSVDNPTTIPITSVDNSTQPTITTPPTSEGEGDDFYYLNYSHVLKADDIKNTNGGTTKDINGLTWNYSSHTYKSDSTKGVQIGSANRPQTTPFTLKATLPSGIVFTSAYVEVAVAQGGSSTFEIAFGNSTKSSTFSKTDIEMFSYEDLNYEASTIQFSFKASVKALYVYSFGFSVQVPNDIELNLSGDADIEVDPVEPGVNNIPKISYTPISKETYYENISTTATGDSLVNSLRKLTSTMTATSYEQAKYMLQYTDENPAKPGYLYGMYDGDNIVAEWKAGSTWNREHVWPCSKMQLTDEMRPDASTRNHTSDLHNLRAACPTVNGYHNDKYYGEENAEGIMYPNVTSGIAGKHNFTGDFRGDVARIMFYMYIRYDGLKLTDNIENADNKSMGKLSLFLEWHEDDPVDNFEIQRNNRIYAYQGNRNPFIDYPEYVDRIF